MSVNNPRWPHHVTVTREVNTGTEYDPVITTTILLDSECRNYISVKASEKNGVIESGYTVSVPPHRVNILTGDKIVVVDYVRTIEGTVKGSQVGNIGANIYYDEIKN